MTSVFFKHSFLNHLTGSIKDFQNDVKSSSYIRDDDPTGFHNLPTNILLCIFKNLKEEELRRNIIPVCHKWRQVALLPILWNTISFNGLYIPANFMCQQLRSFPLLKNIYLINIDDTTTVIRQICRCNTQIETITIKNCRNDKVDVKIPERVLRNLVTSCKNLRLINLKGTLFRGNLFYIEVALLPNLTSVNFSNNVYLTTKNIFEFILNCQQLEEFKLSYRNRNQYMSDNDAVFLFSNMKYSLKSITFDMMELTDISFKTLLECNKLEKLCLYNSSNISPELLSTISEKLPNLLHLKIHHSQVSTNNIINLFKCGTTLNNLETINLTGSWKLNSEGFEILTKGCPKLKKAIFRCCKNLDNIDCLVKNANDLQILDVSFCSKLSTENLLNITLLLSKLNTLYIDSSKNNVSTILKRKKPFLIIYIYMSEYNKTLKKKL